jgi:putative ABC transport system substrate-binding protein
MIADMLAPGGAGGQQPAKVPRVGILFGGTLTAAAQFNDSFTQGLRERGYVEGRSIIVERRYAGGSGDRINEIAAELVRTSMDVIVTGTDPTIAAVKRLTQSHWSCCGRLFPSSPEWQ